MRRSFIGRTLSAALLWGVAGLACFAQAPAILPPSNGDAKAVDQAEKDAKADDADALEATNNQGMTVPYLPTPPEQRIPPLAYNYYYPAPGSPYMPARMYMSPRPVPPRVGYTYITYQAFAPHEYLHRHARWYYSIHPGSGTTITKISWR